RLWPLAIVTLYLLAPAQRVHLWGGFSIPAAILIVRGWPRVRKRLSRWSRTSIAVVGLAGLCVVVGLAPVHYVLKLETYRDGVQQTAELARDDARSLNRISELGGGGVLTAWALAAW